MIEVAARAKINLHLHITGRRDDGYHLLDSLVARIDIVDTIRIKKSSTFQINVSGHQKIDCAIDDNLATRAVRALSPYHNHHDKICLDISKNIPIGAGLGGGSADCAATLLALNQFWNLGLSQNTLCTLAATIGSDIAACLMERSIIMRDTGNTLLPAPAFPVLYAVLVTPATACATPAVYQAYRTQEKEFSHSVSFPSDFEDSKTFCDFLRLNTRNDLTDAACRINPDVAYVLDALHDFGDAYLVRMSGSGSSCFAIFANEDTAIKHADKLKKLHPSWWVKPVRINERYV